jgi:hypothetical protein
MTSTGVPVDRRQFLLTAPPVALLTTSVGADAKPTELLFDGGTPGDPIRALHGVNGGPLAAGGLLDLSVRWKEAAFPLARLHDSHWPNPDVVDIHAVFPDPAADPTKPSSYDFERTDEYLKGVIDAGAEVVYRLGESIEHQKVKRHARPPKDAEKWAAVCVGIVRHYTEGWANGFKWPIRYWEVWNEPDNRPNCWTGTDDDYLKLYAVTAKALKAKSPKLKVGGPGVGNVGSLTKDGIDPAPFVSAFLARCKADALPLDFFSWHCYTADPLELVRRARGVRKLLDEAGFKGAESHLNEWNYLPGNDWNGLAAKDALVRQKWYDRLNGPEGAAFVVASLIRLQDAPVDVANYFTAEAPGMGLFSQHGVPSKAFHAFRAFRAVTKLRRLASKNDVPSGVTALAGVSADGTIAVVLLARHAGDDGTVPVDLRPAPWAGATEYEVLGVDEKNELTQVMAGKGEECKVTVDLPLSSVRLIRLAKEKPGR